MNLTWSPVRTLVVGATLILATNAVALVGVVYNRSGEPDSQLTLSERELSLPNRGWRQRENSGIALRLDWRVPHRQTEAGANVGGFYSYGPPEWLNRAKLDELGFDVSKPFDSATGARRYGRLLPKEVLLVLELSGRAYQDALDAARRHAKYEADLYADNPEKKEFKSRAETAEKALYRQEHVESRLFVVDAGLNERALRARYPDRAKYAIVLGQVRAEVYGTGSDRQLAGYVSTMSVSEINVDLSYRSMFEPLLQRRRSRGDETDPRYEVTVAFGQRLEPWIKNISFPSSR